MTLLSKPTMGSFALLSSLLCMGGSAVVQNSASTYLTVDNAGEDASSFVTAPDPTEAVALVVGFAAPNGDKAKLKQDLLAHAKLIRGESNADFYEVYEEVGGSQLLTVEYFPTDGAVLRHRGTNGQYETWKQTMLDGQYKSTFRMEYTKGTATLGKKQVQANSKILDVGWEARCPNGYEQHVAFANMLDQAKVLRDAANVEDQGFTLFQGVDEFNKHKLWMHEATLGAEWSDSEAYKNWKKFYFTAPCIGYFGRLETDGTGKMQGAAYVGGVTVKTEYTLTPGAGVTGVPAAQLQGLASASVRAQTYEFAWLEGGTFNTDKKIPVGAGTVVANEVYPNLEAWKDWTKNDAIKIFRDKNHLVAGGDTFGKKRVLTAGITFPVYGGGGLKSN